MDSLQRRCRLSLPPYRAGRPGCFRPIGGASGVTLIELLAVITIVAILMSIGVPSYRYINTSYRIAGEVNGLLGDLQFARAEAIKEGQPVTVCISSDGASCALANTAWQSGWIIFSDPNQNQTVDVGETVLRIQPAFTGSDTFQADTALSSVTFSREGFALNLPNAGTTLTLHDSTSNSNWTRCLSMTLIGVMTVQTHANTATCT